jgi:cytoskeleton protein RodZ
MTSIQADLATPLSPATRRPAGPGASLKAAREQAGLSLDQVAQALKLAPRQVKALEDEDFGQLPGRTFARGFVRNYARLLSLDGEELLAQLPDATHAPALAAPSLHATGTTMGEVPATHVVRPDFTRWLILLLLVAGVLGAGAYAWYRGGIGLTKRPEAPATTAAVQPARSAAGRAQTDLPNPLSAMQPAAPAPVENQGSSLGPATASKEAGPAASPAPSSGASSMAATESANVAAAAQVPASLVLSYRGPSWTEVRDAHGQVLLTRLVPAGSEQQIRGQAPFDVTIGNARAVTLVYRDKPVDLSRYTRQNIARLRLP